MSGKNSTLFGQDSPDFNSEVQYIGLDNTNWKILFLDLEMLHALETTKYHISFQSI